MTYTESDIIRTSELVARTLTEDKAELAGLEQFYMGNLFYALVYQTDGMERVRRIKQALQERLMEIRSHNVA